MQRLLEIFMSTPWLYWGLGPTLAATLGFVAVSVFCEWAIRQPWAQSAFIVYTEDGDRLKDLADTRSKIAWEAQVAACASHRRVRQRRRSLWIVSGPINIVGVSVIRYVFPLIVGPPRSLLPPLWQFALHFVLLALIADLGLYWGHRIQHESTFLWERFHSLHHRLKTPSSWSTAYIDSTDALLQSAVPLFVAGAVVGWLGLHPVTYTVYVGFHLANNAWNHSGLDATWVNIASLKFLPLRCSNTLHDAHHRFSGYGPKAKNFAEMFWLWDYVFGTLSNTQNLARHQK